MNNFLPPVAIFTAQAVLPSQGSWDSLFFGLFVFIIVCGFAISSAKKSSTKQTTSHVSSKGALGACCAFNFLVGAVIVQVAATAVYLALFNAMSSSLAIGALILVWGVFALSGGISGYFGKSSLSIGAAVLSIIAVILGATDSFGLAEFSAVASASVSLDFLPISVLALLGLVSLSASVGTVALCVPKKLSVSISPLTLTMEVGQSQKITATASGGYHNYIYQWYLNNKPINDSEVKSSTHKGNKESSYSFVPAERGTYEIYVQVTDRSSSAFKRSDATATSKLAVITVVPSPLLACVINASPSTIDIGQSSHIVQSKPVSGGVKPYSYQWFEKDASGRFVAIKDANREDYRLLTSEGTELGAKSYRLQVTDALGNVVTSNVAKLQINAIPTVSVSAESPRVDAYKTLVLRASISGGTEPCIIQWYVDSKKAAQGSDATFNFASAIVGEHEVYVNVLDSATPSVTAKSKILAIKVVPIPLVAPIIAANPSTVGVGQSALFTQSKLAFGGIAPYRYQWFETDSTGSFVPINGATEQQYCYVSEEAGITKPKSHRLEVSDSHGSVVVSNAVTVKVNPPLKISEFTPKHATVGVGDPQQFTVIAIGGTGEYRYEWYLNSRRVGTNTSTYVFSALKTGLYRVSVNVFDTAPTPAMVQSEPRYVANCILPEAVGDINKWRAAGDFDRVLGLDILDFVENTVSEEDFVNQLDRLRDYREAWCAKQGWARTYTNAAIAESYQALKSGRRNILYARRLAPRLFDEWKICDNPGLNNEDLRTRRTDYMNALLHSIEQEDTENAWSNFRVERIRDMVKEKILKQSGLSIGIYLANDEIKRDEDAIFFLKDAIERNKKSEDKLQQANNWLGVTLCNLHRYREALPYLEEALRLQETDLNYQNLIGALMQLEDWYRAKEVCNRYGDRLKFKTPHDIRNYAIILANLREFQSALFVAEKGVEIAKEIVSHNPTAENRAALESCKKLVGDLKQIVNQNPYYRY